MDNSFILQINYLHGMQQRGCKIAGDLNKFAVECYCDTPFAPLQVRCTVFCTENGVYHSPSKSGMLILVKESFK